MKLNEAELLAKRLLCRWNLNDTSFKFDNSKSRFGSHSIRKNQITLSRELTKLNSNEVVEDVILHEIAHALDWKHNRNSGHGLSWKAICIEIGCKPERCYGKEVITPKGKYIAYCDCGIEKKYHRKVSVACRSCCNKYNNGEYSNKYKLKFKEVKS